MVFDFINSLYINSKKYINKKIQEVREYFGRTQLKYPLAEYSFNPCLMQWHTSQLRLTLNKDRIYWSPIHIW